MAFHNIRLKLSGPCQGTVEVDGQNIACRSVKFEGQAGHAPTLTLTIPAVRDTEIDVEGANVVVKEEGQPHRPTCSTCRFWFAESKDSAFGACRRYPPTDGAGAIVPISLKWPRLHGGLWCGEHQPNEAASTVTTQ